MSLNFKDNEVVASISQDCTVRLWDLASGKEVRNLSAERGGYYDVCFSPDRRTLACCGVRIRIWETKTYQVIHEFGDTAVLKCGWIHCLAFSPDGKILAAGSQDGVIRFWNPANGKMVHQVEAHKEGVKSLAFSCDGKYLASAGDGDGALVLREANTGKEIRRLFQGPPRACSRLAFSPDGKRLAWSWGPDRIIHLFEIPTGKETRQQTGHQLSIAAVAFSSDGQTIASAGSDSTVRLRNLRADKETIPSANPQDPVFALAFGANDSLLASASWGGTLCCWDSATGKELWQFKEESGWPRLLALSPDGQSLISEAACLVRRWDVRTGKEMQRFRVRDGDVPCALSPDGKMLAAGHDSEPGRLYDMVTGKEVGRFPQAFNLAFLPDGRFLVIRNRESFALWDVKEDKRIHWFHESRGVRALCFVVSPDGKTLIAGTDEQMIHRWNIWTGERYPGLDSQQKEVRQVAFSPDGRTLASGGADGSVRLWEMASGQQRGVFRGHQGPVLSLVYSSDGRRLASGSQDTTILVWDLTAGLAAVPGKNLTAAQLDGLWRDLAAEDAGKAYRSIWKLVHSPKQSLPFLQTRIRPLPAVDGKRAAQLLSDLDSEDFKVRTKAHEELAKLGEAVAAPLRKTAEKPPSIEVGRRVKELLDKLESERRAPSSERIRVLRAIEVLEYIGTPEARQVLNDLAGGAAEVQQTQEAKASLARLAKRAKPSR
jgi:WD40 repeat protein